MTNRTRVVIATAGAGALAVGGFVTKRVIAHARHEDRVDADPIAETPTAPPGAEEKPVPKPKPAPKAKAEKAAPKPKAAKPPKATGKDPHHALNNPVVDDPDLTEYPDPYDTREDPLDEARPEIGAESTSEPPLQQDPEVENGGKPPRREKLDD